jgi:hypothetical protein
MLVPVIVLVSALLIAGWRIWWVNAQVGAAAESGARYAVVASDPANAVGQIWRDLTAAGIACKTANIYITGSNGTYTANVTCGISLADLLVPMLPGDYTAEARSTHSSNKFEES